MRVKHRISGQEGVLLSRGAWYSSVRFDGEDGASWVANDSVRTIITALDRKAANEMIVELGKPGTVGHGRTWDELVQVLADELSDGLDYQRRSGKDIDLHELAARVINELTSKD